jgi:hypothetical protein
MRSCSTRLLAGLGQPAVLARVVALFHLHLAQKCVQRLAVRPLLRRAHGGLQLRFHGFPFRKDGALVGRDALARFSQLDFHPRLHDEPG